MGGWEQVQVESYGGRPHAADMPRPGELLLLNELKYVKNSGNWFTFANERGNETVVSHGRDILARER